MSIDRHGNVTAREGVDRCECGSKYWEKDRCVDCGAAHKPSDLSHYALTLLREQPALSRSHVKEAARLESTKHTNQMTDVELAKVYAAHVGISSREGGWIYSPSGRPIIQGWWQYAQLLKNSGRIKVGSGINWPKTKGA